jgi:hypothetical protein
VEVAQLEPSSDAVRPLHGDAHSQMAMR